jgi:hypothetical protein
VAFEGVNKWNLAQRIPNVIAGQTYNFTAYICIGTQENVRVTMALLVATYPGEQVIPIVMVRNLIT